MPKRKGIKTSRKEWSRKTQKKSVKRQAELKPSHGDFLMSSDEDVQYCAEFLQQRGYKTIATHGVLGAPLLYVKWGEEQEKV